MATIQPTFEHDGLGDDTIVVTWTPVTASDIAAPIGPNYTSYADRLVQIVGTFDSVTAVLQGSSDGTNFFGLTDPQGNAISKTAAGGETVMESPPYVKPTFSGGGGSQSVSVVLTMRRGR